MPNVLLHRLLGLSNIVSCRPATLSTTDDLNMKGTASSMRCFSFVDFAYDSVQNV